MRGETVASLNQGSDGSHRRKGQPKSGGLLGRIRQMGDQATEALDQATGGRLRTGLDATKEKVTDVGSTVSGKKIQQQLEEFTDVVSTAVIGVHRDQRNLRDSLTQLQVQQTGLKLEHVSSSRGTSNSQGNDIAGAAGARRSSRDNNAGTD